jgi:predicted nucleic acid-binding protein
MSYLLDSSVCSDILRDEPATIARLELIGAERVYTSSIVLGEVFYGIERLPPGKRKRDLEERAEDLFASIECAPVTPAISRRYGALTAARQAAGLGMGENDLWIAATALSLGATLATRDSDFDNTEGQSIENWSLPA